MGTAPVHSSTEVTVATSADVIPSVGIESGLIVGLQVQSVSIGTADKFTTKVTTAVTTFSFTTQDIVPSGGTITIAFITTCEGRTSFQS